MSNDPASWHARGAFVDDLFTVDIGPRSGETIVALHGYPTSSHDWHAVADRLAADRRFVVHDHLGFGFSPRPKDASYALKEQASRAVAVWQSLGIERVHLVAHDYGTSVATELLARRERGELPIELQSVTLCNGSVHIELATMSLIQKMVPMPIVGDVLARLASYRLFAKQMRRITADGLLTETDIEAMWELRTRDGGRAVLPKIARYVEERKRHFDEWVGAWSRLDVPALILWGRKDTVAIPAIAEALAEDNPRADLLWLEALGHYPMLEGPEEWADAYLAFVGMS